MDGEDLLTLLLEEAERQSNPGGAAKAAPAASEDDDLEVGGVGEQPGAKPPAVPPLPPPRLAPPPSERSVRSHASERVARTDDDVLRGALGARSFAWSWPSCCRTLVFFILFARFHCKPFLRGPFQVIVAVHNMTCRVGSTSVSNNRSC